MAAARVDLDAQELLRRDLHAFHLEAKLVLPQLAQHLQDLALDAFHVLERDVEEIAGP